MLRPKSNPLEEFTMRAKTLLLTVGTAFVVHGLISHLYSQGVTASTSAPSTTSAVAMVTDTDVNVVTADPKDTYSKLLGPATKAKDGKRARLDVAFCIDTTSSMQGEIDTVKAKVKSMVSKLSSSKEKPIVRVGLVAYRDKGDDYVTKVFPFSENIDQVVKDISQLSAEGGGDGPEAVDCGLHSAVNDLQWNEKEKTAKLLFLIGDAPPHLAGRTYDWRAESKKAIAKGIHINTIGCEGLETTEEEGGIKVFKKIAQLTNGNFEPLSYHSEIVRADGTRATLITAGGATYSVKSTDKDAWKKGAEELASVGAATIVAADSMAPTLQGATNGSIGPQGADATYVSGVNTAGTVRADNNLDSIMLKGASEALSNIMK
jgi:Mg-chelatase subunit ChlD